MLVVATLVAGGAATFSAGTAQAAALSAVLIRTVDTGAWATPSPDPAGITYDAANNRLVLSDSEVDEMSLYQGRNVFFSTLDGQQTAGNTGWTTVPWSSEPTGISYQTAGHVLVSDDDQDRVFVVDTGADGVWTPEDGTPSSFSTRPLNGDAEDVTMDMDATTNGHVLVDRRRQHRHLRLRAGPQRHLRLAAPDRRRHAADLRRGPVRGAGPRGHRVLPGPQHHPPARQRQPGRLRARPAGAAGERRQHRGRRTAARRGHHPRAAE